MPLILGTNSIKDTGYDVANSCRFNDNDSASMSRTTETPTNVDKYTFSVWIKRGNLGIANCKIFSIGSGTYGEEKLELKSDDLLWRRTEDDAGETDYERQTDRVFRDPSAWMHIFIAYDSSDGTAGDRMKMYINGVRETSFSGSINPDSNENALLNTASKTLYIGRYKGSDIQHYDGYMAELAFVDGVDHAVTDFGEFDSDSPTIWKPKDISSGITWGNNGFYLDFEDSSALGNDVSGNNNDFTVANLAATDQASDSPTNNFCTMNSLANKVTSVTFSEGNLKTDFANGRGGSSSTFGLTTGKWYVEKNITTMPQDERFHLGVVPFEIQDADDMINTNNQGIGISGFNAVIYADSGSGSAVLDNFFGNNTTRFDSWTGIIGMALDLTSGSETIAFSKDGAWVTGSGTTDTDFSNATKLDISTPLARHDVWHIACGTGNSTGTSGVFSMNFGSPPFSISSGNSDGNNLGNFEYAVPSGYYALCTKNLAEFGG